MGVCVRGCVCGGGGVETHSFLKEKVRSPNSWTGIAPKLKSLCDVLTCAAAHNRTQRDCRPGLTHLCVISLVARSPAPRTTTAAPKEMVQPCLIDLRCPLFGPALPAAAGGPRHHHPAPRHQPQQSSARASHL